MEQELRFWPVCITEKKNIWADYEQLLRPAFLRLRGKKKFTGTPKKEIWHMEIW